MAAWPAGGREVSRGAVDDVSKSVVALGSAAKTASCLSKARVSRARSAGAGGRERTRRKAQVIWAVRSGEDFIAFSARTREASVQVTSFNVVRAWSGVEVTPARTLQACRLEASNIFTGPTVRRQNV